MNESHCSAPPLVENSRMLSSDKDWSVGATALYSCEEGFHITGQSEIVCDDDNGVVDWSGELPECIKLGIRLIILLISSIFILLQKISTKDSCGYTIVTLQLKFSTRLVVIIASII